MDQCCGSETISIRIRIRPAGSFDSETFISDTDSTKSFGSLRIRIRNTALNRYQIPGKAYKYGTYGKFVKCYFLGKQMEHVIDEIPLMIYKLERFITTLKVRNKEII